MVYVQDRSQLSDQCDLSVR